MVLPRDPKILRKLILQKRKEIPLEVRNQKFLEIISHLNNLPEYQKATSVLGYFGKISSGEFDTTDFLKEILISNKHLYLPRCAENKIQLDLYRIYNLEQDVEEGAYQIMEPIINRKNYVSIADLDLVIVPGSVFDREGRRYGYGAGYYDSLLTSYSGVKIAFALTCTVMDFALQVHPKDISVDILITPDEIIRNPFF